MQKGKDLILVTGATGQQGSALARHLLFHGHNIRAMTRKPDGEAAKKLASMGAEVVRGDYDDAKSLEAACTGAWGAFSVQNSWETGVVKEVEHGKRFAEIAKSRGVQHFVYTSVGSAHRNTGIPHFDSKWEIERHVRAAGFPTYTILRPVFFMDNFATPMFGQGIRQGALPVGMKPTSTLQMISVDDIGRFGLLAFEQPHHMNRREIDLAGDELTMPQAAAILSEVAGRKIEFVQTPIAEVRKFSEDMAIMLEWFDKTGYDAQIRTLIADYRIRPTTFVEWANTSKGWR
jgi:uncharacterized protein YbjT (DUF2867 family)